MDKDKMSYECKNCLRGLDCLPNLKQNLVFGPIVDLGDKHQNVRSHQVFIPNQDIHITNKICELYQFMKKSNGVYNNLLLCVENSSNKIPMLVVSNVN
jgi:hypothetical protein